MFGRKKKNKKEVMPVEKEPETTKENSGDKTHLRFHSEGLGDVWAALTGRDPRQIMPQVVGTVLHEGGTRPAWQWKRAGMEYILMAWPQDQPIRAAVLMAGPEGGELKPVTAVPLLEGLPIDLTIAEVHPRAEGMGADVAVSMLEGQNPMWFFDPLYGRDKDDLTPEITHTFWLSAAAFAIRKALLDEVAITSGVGFEEHAKKWLEENPGKSRLDVPPLKLIVKDKHFIMPGRRYCEYQLRAKIKKIEDYTLETMPIKALYLTFPFNDRPDMNLVLFASKAVLQDYEPEEGQEIEAYAWFQGRIIDLEQVDPQTDDNKTEN